LSPFAINLPSKVFTIFFLLYNLRNMYLHLP
jgi:hypothetical protein